MKPKTSNVSDDLRPEYNFDVHRFSHLAPLTAHRFFAPRTVHRAPSTDFMIEPRLYGR